MNTDFEKKAEEVFPEDIFEYADGWGYDRSEYRRQGYVKGCEDTIVSLILWAKEKSAGCESAGAMKRAYDKLAEELEGMMTKRQDRPEAPLCLDNNANPVYDTEKRDEYMDVYEASEKFDEEHKPETYYEDGVPVIARTTLSYAFRCGSEWKEKHMFEKAVDGWILGDIKNQETEPYQIWAESVNLPMDGKFKIGDKVKMLIFKDNK